MQMCVPYVGMVSASAIANGAKKSERTTSAAEADPRPAHTNIIHDAQLAAAPFSMTVASAQRT